MIYRKMSGSKTLYFVSMDDMEAWLAFYVLTDARYTLMTQIHSSPNHLLQPESNLLPNKTRPDLMYTIRRSGPSVFDCLARVPLEAPTLVIGHSLTPHIFWSGYRSVGQRRRRRTFDRWQDVLKDRPKLTLYTCYRDLVTQEPIDCILLPGWDEYERPGNYMVPSNKAGLCANRRYLRLLGKFKSQHCHLERYCTDYTPRIKLKYQTQVGLPWRKYIIKSQLVVTFQLIPMEPAPFSQSPQNISSETFTWPLYSSSSAVSKRPSDNMSFGSIPKRLPLYLQDFKENDEEMARAEERNRRYDELAYPEPCS